jgi:ribosome recycling factor
MQKKEAQKKAWGSLRPHRTDAQVKAKKQKTKRSKRKDTAKTEEREVQKPEPQEETIKPVDAIRRGKTTETKGRRKRFGIRRINK